MVTFEEAMNDWRRAVIGAQPVVNADFVRETCVLVVRRAKTLSETNRLNFPEVAAFLLTRSRDWVLGGLPVIKIAEKLPKDLSELGIMMMAEGGVNGSPLPASKLKQVHKHHRIIQ